MRKYFNTIGNKYYWCGNEHGGYGFGEWKFFSWSSMPMHVHLRVLRIYFLRYQENSHPENFHQSNSPLVNPLWKILTWNIPTHAFKYSRRVFLISLLLPLSLILLKRLPCNSMFKSAEVFSFVKSCPNKVLSEERQLMKWVVIIQVRIFWVPIFWRWEFSRGVFDGWEFFGWEFPRGKEFS